MGGKTANKAAYFDKLKALLEEYSTLPYETGVPLAD
jgi:hypothetical protein